MEMAIIIRQNYSGGSIATYLHYGSVLLCLGPWALSLSSLDIVALDRLID